MRALLFALLLAAPSLARADVIPAEGDARRGAGLFRINCAGCHGPEGRGDGFLAKSLKPAPKPMGGTAYAIAHSDAELFDIIKDGISSSPMPAFGDALSELERWDLIAFIRAGSHGVTDFFPSAGRYLVKDYALDQYALERLQKALGTAVAPPERTIEVATVFNGDRAPGQPPIVEPQDPVTLDSLKPKDRLGYIAFVSAQLPGDAKPEPIAIATDREGKIVKALSLNGRDDAARDKLLAAYVGQGKKGPHLPLQGPREKSKKQKPLPEGATLTGFDAAYARAMEAITMYDKDERDRTWADAPSR